ncbi:MAG: hypothetical protein LBF40_06090 [Deltaproteobacteria bacterium]|jgi:flavodoxin|nr:hypothetical protein [Deltaproteobacteria bacterium]
MKARTIPILALALAILAALVLYIRHLPATAQEAGAAGQPPSKPVEYVGGPDAFGKNLIVVFSLTGNTLKLGKLIQSHTGGDIFQIETTTDYPTGDDLIPFAKAQRENNQPVAFKAQLPDISGYETIFFGTPAWFHDIPYPVSVFLKETGFGGKRVIPFVTSGGGPGDIVQSFYAAIKDGSVDEALLISRYSAKPQAEIDNAVNTWLNGLATKQ